MGFQSKQQTYQRSDLGSSPRKLCARVRCQLSTPDIGSANHNFALEKISLKVCTKCHGKFPLTDFYSKGLRRGSEDIRRDSQCIHCCLKLKKDRRAKAKSKSQRRSKTKVIELNNYKIQESYSETPSISKNHLVDILRSYILESVLGQINQGALVENSKDE